MTCRSCGSENRPGRLFCSECGASLAIDCPACGADNEPADKFCGTCGAALIGHVPAAIHAPGAPSAAPGRRLVTVLFADLVGFTTLSEHRDPEQVRELLSTYFERCRTLIQRYGGTVEKFIGDAVMAVWGAPVAREDDAERAVRAAIAVTNAITALGAEVGIPELRARAGVLTGRAAVDRGAEGEGMVLGDTVNTASRLQSIATPGTVLVDDVTRRASEAAIAYEDAGLHPVKGREQPVHAWTALRVVAGAGGARRGAGLEPQFVGRQRELDVVIESAEQSADDRQARLVTVLGEAGSGKSRLLWEFFKYIDGINDTRWWHQGRCLSYGDGVAYWALAEMVRARAGILEEEDATSARAKLTAVVEQHISDERERRLVEPRLAHLLGLEQRTSREAADLFAGWRLFFERLAQTRPVILAFEDLQWADSGLLDFIDHLLDWSAEHPIFVLALGRPELAARRPAAPPPVQLGPLGPDAMMTLLDSVVPGLPPELAGQIVERAEGVPLYAVETVRMLLDRGVLEQDGQRYVLTGPVADLEVPETLQALVTARLDELSESERTLLQDAAVLGMSFAPGAVATVSGRPEREVTEALDALVAKQVLERYDDARAGEPGQYHLLQALLRTIALGTLSRRELKARHLAAAEYLRATWGEATEIAEVLASHYIDAVDAEPDAADADAIRTSARETLTAAGHRAVSLALGVEARRYFEQAAALADDDLERARLLAEAGVAAGRSADWSTARMLLTDAITVLETGGRIEDAARTRALLADVLIDENRLLGAAELIERAREDLTDELILAELAARRARIAHLTGDFERALQEVDAALAIADPHAMHGVMADAIITKSNALLYARRFVEGEALQSLGLQIALEHDITDQALRAYFNLAEFKVVSGRSDDARTMVEAGIGLARERGNRGWERDLLAQQVGVHAFLGEWDEALALADSLSVAGADDSTRLAATFCAVIHAARGETDELEAWLEQPPPTSQWHELELMEGVVHGLALRLAGRIEEAAPLMVRAVSEVINGAYMTAAFQLDEVIDTLLEAGEHQLLEEVLGNAPRPVPAMRARANRARGRLLVDRGMLAEGERAIAQAVSELRDSHNNPFALARAQLDHGSVLIDLGRLAEAAAVLRSSQTLLTGLRAVPWLERVDELLSPLHTAA